jgi:hypothetical protein
VTQSERNRNLSKSLPKRFGFLDLAIESIRSQEGGRLIDLISELKGVESALQHAFLAMQQQIRFKLAQNGAYGHRIRRRPSGRPSGFRLKAL